ncbi:MAG: hydroxyacid dehydrogenase [Rhodospirillales bacterium 70-18]|nr:D-2-hydroxyacid dehydrogenase [Rhodospirillales bacterium]OJY70243.1 MAG: hydroxyacid dehydrogenase [Rhodospirillales bacterium 70-18]
MRIHIQNPPPPADGSPDPFIITAAQVEQAAARGGETEAHTLSFGNDAASFAAGIADAEAVVTTPGQILGRFPVAAPRLRMIFCTSAGLDRLLPFDWLPPGVALLNNRGVHSAKVGEYSLMALLMLAARVPAYATQQRAGVWKPFFTPILRGRRLLVVGTGDLGAAGAREARRYGMHVTGVRARPAPHPDFDAILGTDALDAALADTEFLLLACPLTPATRNILDRRRLGLLPAGAGLINVGRGALLDQDALCDLLEAGRLSGAVLDVTVPEPLPPDARLWRTPNLLVTPHVAADNPETYNVDSLDIFFANLRAARAGEAMPNLVDPGRGY